MKRATPTPIQALRLKQQGPIRLPKLSKPIKAHWDDRRSHPMVKKIPGMPSRPEYKIKRWNEVERSTVQGRKAGPLAVHCFTATAKRKARRAKPRPAFHFGVDWDGPCLTGKIEQLDQAQKKSAKRSGLKRSSSQRAQQRRQYSKARKAYLLAHPLCQITIFLLRLDEAKVIAGGGTYLEHGNKYPPSIRHVPRADQLHHRNRTNGIRLLNFDYIISACTRAHQETEQYPISSRSLGLLCPINCKPDGTMPDGTKQPTTTELLAQRHAAKSP